MMDQFADPSKSISHNTVYGIGPGKDSK